jgi:hypothetical protein
MWWYPSPSTSQLTGHYLEYAQTASVNPSVAVSSAAKLANGQQ